ncbi:MAG: UDP-N-acetylmuramoylalanine--D-glutamate ligase [Elusimicrobia bacterium GWA2_61_42]|nr:MAG: UDP-N-acetylmuramoylalanine--D-glutamate ligase [Elusimicrobia bacterium GWA2_61_42]OGR74122.1 MAG: UDP-N-acetylmuramoylalanine--D-glutamate ligase [Elusimicrobia bacterium GWC2_61_25]
MFTPEKFKGKRALVIGAGRSGVACANLLAGRGFDVLLTEKKKAGELKKALKDLSRRVKTETGGHTAEAFGCGFAVKSPGLSHANPLIAALKKRKIPVFSEIETALAFSAGTLLAVTGTNGKTTTTMLLGELMKRALGRKGRALVCGNVGIPAAAVAAKARPGDAVIMEVSSYQLEDSAFLKPAAACVLNITPDHLDHHGSMAAYVKAKEKVFRFQDRGGSCVFNYEDAYCRRLAKGCPSKALFFSSRRTGGKLAAWVSGDKLFFKTGKAAFSVRPPNLPGAHNLENAMCAGLMALSAGAAPVHLKEAFAAFKGVEHRIEPAGKARGVNFINDSKATNVDSTLVALRALGAQKNVWLILGGLDKGNPYAPLLPLIRKSAKGVLTIGAAAPKIERELAGAAPIITALTMERACRNILQLAAPGDIALFSPACASFDQFRDFEDRGRKFKAFVRKLK